MKKLIGLIAAMACAFALCVSLAGCGGVDKSGFLGNWTLEDGTDATLDADSISLMKSLGQSVYLTISEDGTGSMDMFGQKLDATWEATSATEGKITLNGAESTLTLADEKLTVTDSDGRYLRFAKFEGDIPVTTPPASTASATAASAASAANATEGTGQVSAENGETGQTTEEATGQTTETTSTEQTTTATDTQSATTDTQLEDTTDESTDYEDDGSGDTGETVDDESSYEDGEGEEVDSGSEDTEETGEADVYYESEA